jgi:hypothetical protein
MGMHLVPLRKDAESLKYNWWGWGWLLESLLEWEVDISTFSAFSAGEVIPEATCLRVADALAAHLDELPQGAQEWLSGHVDKWRQSGGFHQD